MNFELHSLIFQHNKLFSLVVILYSYFILKCIDSLESDESEQGQDEEETPIDISDDVRVQNQAENCIGTPTDTTDDVQVQNQAENRMETSIDPIDDVQVQNQAENHMETPTDPTDDVQAQNQAAICIEVHIV